MGKKRKHESQHDEGEQQQYNEQEQQYYEEDAQPAQFQRPQTGATGSRVEDETLAYLTEVAEHLATIRDPEERQLLVGNVLEEIQGKELRIASDAVTSRLLEQFLLGAPAAQLMQFLEAFTNEDMMFSLAGSAFGSHVAEKVLAGLHSQAAQLDTAQAEHLEQLLAGMVGAIGSNLFDYIMDKHATHVARALLVVIAGRDVLSPTGKKHQQHQQAHQQQQGDEEQEQDPAKAAAAAAAARGNRPAFKPSRSSLQEKVEGNRPQQRAAAAAVRFPKLLSRYAKMLPCYDAANMALLGKNTYSGPFLQAMLRAAAADEELLHLLLPPILGVDAAKAAAAEPGSVLATLTDSHVGRLLRDDVYSRLLEVAVAVMPQQQRQQEGEGQQGQQQQQQSLAGEFYQRFLKGRLLPLSNHHSANFVVQAWLAASSSPARVSELLTELAPHLTELLKRRRSGVLTALVGAAARAGPGPHQAAVVDATAAALTGLAQWQGREGTDHLAPALMTLDSNVTMGSSSSSSAASASAGSYRGGASGGRLSTPGCAILATLLQHYPRKVARPFIASVTALSPPDAARAAQDPAGSRALQALVEGPAGHDAKSALLQKLAGSWADVALQAAGSFFLEKAYAWADLEQKEAIVREVAARQTTLLAGCYWGPKLSQKLGLDSYLRSPDEWRKRAASAAAASKAFEALLSDDARPTTAAAADKAGRQKKKKRQQQEQETAGEADAQQLLAAALDGAADGSKGKRSKKAKKEAKLAQQQQHQQEAAAGPAAAAVDDVVDTSAQQPKNKQKQLRAGASTHNGVADDEQQQAAGKEKKSSKKKKLAAAAGGDTGAGVRPAAAAGGSTGDFVALLGCGLEGLGHQKQSKKSKKKAG